MLRPFGFACVVLLAMALPLPLWAKPWANPYPPFVIQLQDAPGLKKALSQGLEEARSNDTHGDVAQTPALLMALETDRLNRLLRAKGYYAAQVEGRLGDTLTYSVQPGVLSVIETLTLDLPPLTTAFNPLSLGLKVGQPLEAKAVLDAVERLEQHYLAHSCWYQVKAEYTLTLNPATAGAQLTLGFTPSSVSQFGEVRFEGAPDILPQHLAQYLTFNRGDCYQQQALDDTRLALLQSGLVSSLAIDSLPPEKGVVNLVFRLTPRPARTLKGGLSYDADAGGGIALGWEHRNVFGQGENLAFSSALSQRTRSLGTAFSLPHFLAQNQTFKLYSQLKDSQPDAFHNRQLDSGLSLTRKLSPKISWSLGARTLLNQIEVQHNRDWVGLLGLPLSLEVTAHRPLLDPLTGWNLGLKTEPFWDIQTPSAVFIKTTAATSIYRSASAWPLKPTLAGRMAAGSLAGQDLTGVPITERFFVGGGGSVRGYPYQSLGPRLNNTSLGGLSYGEASLELRLRFNPNWGMVLFADAGQAYSRSLPAWGTHFKTGAGLGLRYYTRFTPLRVDIARPLDRQDTALDPFQVYISIGQAF